MTRSQGTLSKLVRRKCCLREFAGLSDQSTQPTLGALQASMVAVLARSGAVSLERHRVAAGRFEFQGFGGVQVTSSKATMVWGCVWRSNLRTSPHFHWLPQQVLTIFLGRRFQLCASRPLHYCAVRVLNSVCSSSPLSFEQERLSRRGITEAKGYSWSYLACRIGYLVPI
jgi:hypothetical protein